MDWRKGGRFLEAYASGRSGTRDHGGWRPGGGKMGGNQELALSRIRKEIEGKIQNDLKILSFKPL